MSRSLIIKLAVLVGIVLFVGLSFVFLPVKDYLETFLTWVQDIGPWGPVVLALAYIPACLFFVPGLVLTLGGGFAFGLVTGTIAISLGSTAGACAAFWVGRTFLRDTISKRIENNERFQAIDRAVGKQGFKVVLLTRLSPVFPFNLLNYAFGLTDVRFRDYALASWIGMLPGTIMYVYLGSATKSIADIVAGKVEGGIGQQLLFGVGLLATIIVTVLVTRTAQKALKEAAPEAVKEADESDEKKTEPDTETSNPDE